MVNELVQWAAIVFLVVLNVGLLRQLGFFMIGPEQGGGPRVGRRLPRELGSRELRERLADLIAADDGVGAGAVLIVSPDSDESLSVLAEAEGGSGRRVPLLTIVSGRDTDSVAKRASAVSDLVWHDETGEAPDRAGITELPFLMWLDENLVVRHNAFGERLQGRVLEWLTPPALAGEVDGARGDVGRPPLEVT